jgi:hypothetical protein
MRARRLRRGVEGEEIVEAVRARERANRQQQEAT